MFTIFLLSNLKCALGKANENGKNGKKTDPGLWSSSNKICCCISSIKSEEREEAGMNCCRFSEREEVSLGTQFKQ